jgi:predicted HD superfamily hydrolase involved in NAD metabolism
VAQPSEPPASAGIALIRAMRRVRKELGQDHRYAHSLRVARFGARLAGAHRADPRQARLAGLYHDIARLYSTERLLDECAARGLAIDAFERANPIVLHAPLGALIAGSEYGVADTAILSAIAKHTVAAAHMTRLDAIVYLADALEPGRRFPERAGYASLALRDLDSAMREVLGSTIAYLRGRDLDIAPQTLAAARSFRTSVASVSGKHLETTIPAPSRSA